MVVVVQLLSAAVLSLLLRALVSGKLKPASRSGQKGSMANLQGQGQVQRAPAVSHGRDGDEPHSRFTLSRELCCCFHCILSPPLHGDSSLLILGSV